MVATMGSATQLGARPAMERAGDVYAFAAKETAPAGRRPRGTSVTGVDDVTSASSVTCCNPPLMVVWMQRTLAGTVESARLASPVSSSAGAPSSAASGTADGTARSAANPAPKKTTLKVIREREEVMVMVGRRSASPVPRA